MKQYQQCGLQREDTTAIAWIEERGAKLGAQVELLPSRDLWKVIAVFDHKMPEDGLKEHQRLHRGSLPSVERMGV